MAPRNGTTQTNRQPTTVNYTMELLIIRQPDVASFSRNPMQYAIAISPYGQRQQSLGFQVVIRVEIEMIYGTNQYAEVENTVLFPNSAGVVQFDISEKIDAYLKYFTPPLNLKAIVPCTEQSKRYRISYYLTNGNVIMVPSATTAPRFAIKGGTDSYFTHPSHLIQNGTGFLTSAYSPDAGADLMQAGEFRFAFFLARQNHTPASAADTPALNAVGYNLVHNATYQYPQPESTFTQWRVYCIPISPQVVFAVAPSKPKRFELDATACGGTIIDAVVDYRPGYEYRQLVYRNSLGGLDTIMLRGAHQDEATYDRQQASLTNFPDQYFDRRLKAAVVSIRATETITIKANTGFVPKWKVDSLRDLFLSEEVYEVMGGRLIPVSVISNKANLYRKDDNLFSVELEYQPSNPSRQYSQPGATPETCPLPLIFAIRQSGSSFLDIMWSLLAPYDLIDIEIIIDTTTTAIRLQGATGRRRLPFTNPATGTTPYAITVRGRTVCDPFSNPISVSGWNTVNFDVYANQAPVAINDVFNINSGYTTPVTLSGSVLDNDYDPDGDNLTITPETSQPTNAGGTYSISSDGTVSYTPPSSAYVGQDFFDYEVVESGGSLPATARAFINVGTGSQGGFVYVRIEEVDVTSYSGGYSGSASGQRRARFYSDPAGTQAINPAALSLTLNIREVTFTRDFYGVEDSSTTDTTVAATSGDVLIFSGEWYNYNGDPFYEYEQLLTISHSIMAGAGYIVI